MLILSAACNDADRNKQPAPIVNQPINQEGCTDDDAPMDDSVFMLNEDMLPQVCGVMVDEECAPLIAYRRDEIAYQERIVTEIQKLMQSVQKSINLQSHTNQAGSSGI